MDEGSGNVPRRARERQHGEGVALERVARVVLRAVHIVVRSAIDDDVRPLGRDNPGNVRLTGHIELAACQRQHVVPAAKPLHDGAAQLTGGTGDHDAHQADRASPRVATTACCCSCVISP